MAWEPNESWEEVTLDADGIAWVAQSGTAVLTSNSGTTDTLVRVRGGLVKGDEVILQPAATHTITATHGANQKLERSADRVMSDNDKLILKCQGSEVFHEIGRPSPDA